jgi:photosystem II stability/assembly factor-like uncharacterized protein
MRKLHTILIVTVGFLPIMWSIDGLAQTNQPTEYAMTLPVPATGLLGSNGVDGLLFVGGDIWFHTGGVGISVLRADGTTGQYSSIDGLGKGGASAMGYDGSRLWVATAFDSTISGASEGVGGGLSVSEDNGHTWRYIPQPVDAVSDTLNDKKPTTVAVNNITFDIAFHDGAAWITSWAGGLRKSKDAGLTWEVVTPDNEAFSVLDHLNHRAFAVISAANGLLVGTSGGINRSTDGGETWTNIVHNPDGSSISGNFITALAEQQTGGRSIIWAASWQADAATEFTAVSFSRNNGLTWETTLPGEKVHNFAFNGDDVYAVSDHGLFKTSDFGQRWYHYPRIQSDNVAVLTEEYFAIGVQDDALWVGTNDGLAQSLNNGQTWYISRTFEPTGGSADMETYAYPNPFSPTRHNVAGDQGHVRVQYNPSSTTKVTLRIFDFAMQKVRTVVQGESRSGGEQAEKWNGLDDTGRMVDNGVYFYRLDLEPGGAFWGKIVVIN